MINREQRYTAMIGFLLGLLIALLLTVMGGCATTDASYTTPDGTNVTFKSRTLFKDVEGFQTEWGSFNASLGSSKGNFTPEQLACLIAPQLGGCQ